MTDFFEPDDSPVQGTDLVAEIVNQYPEAVGLCKASVCTVSAVWRRTAKRFLMHVVFTDSAARGSLRSLIASL